MVARDALACYGARLPEPGEVWLRCLDGLPVSAVTATFLAWCGQGAAVRGKAALLLLWDNASWHISKAVKDWSAPAAGRSRRRALVGSGRRAAAVCRATDAGCGAPGTRGYLWAPPLSRT